MTEKFTQMSTALGSLKVTDPTLTPGRARRRSTRTSHSQVANRAVQTLKIRDQEYIVTYFPYHHKL